MHYLFNVISMGGYGGFIWPAYLAMLFIFSLGFLLPLKKFRKIKDKLRGKN